MGSTTRGLRSFVLLAGATALAGCATEASEPADDGDPTATSESALTVVQGTYRVPAPAELDAVATNPVSVSVLVSNGAVGIVYDLPAVIAGDGARVVLTSRGAMKDGELELRGAGGRATCTLEGADLVCHVTYRDEVVDLAGASAAIDRHAFSPTEAPLRRDLARRFSVDPLGVLTFPLTTTARYGRRPR